MSLVSVIIPAYNQGHYLSKAIESALVQSYVDLEIIVVDDGSTDNTAEAAQGFTDSRVEYVYQENRGLSAARNTGIRHANGRYLTYLDSDDLFLPKKVELLVENLEQDPELGFAAGQAIPVDEEGNQIGAIFDKCLSEYHQQLLLGNPYHVGSVMVKRCWQSRVGFFDESLRSYEDWDMWLRLAIAGCKMGWVDQPVSMYRFHVAQMTRIGNQMTEASFAVLDKLYNDPALPEKWRELHDAAYSNAHLRAAAQGYATKEFPSAKEHLKRAVELNQALVSDDGTKLARRFAGWTDLPKRADPLTFLEDIYNNLPETLTHVHKKRRQELGRAALKLAYSDYNEGNLTNARGLLHKAIRYQPGLLAEQGNLSMLMRSYLQMPKEI